jgi:hypothetical protein
MKFERRHEALLPFADFLRRQVLFTLVAFLIIGGSLFLGMAGYHWICGLGWMDSLLNASMILTGMGPVNPMPTNGAKLFASFYAIFSGVVFLTSVGVFLAPAFHRLLHLFHLDVDEEGGQGVRPRKR